MDNELSVILVASGGLIPDCKIISGQSVIIKYHKDWLLSENQVGSIYNLIIFYVL